MGKIFFPQYRKYKNNKSFFKIISKTQFEEIKFMGEKMNIYYFETKILPDRNFIQDMLFEHEKYWDICSDIVYEELKAKGKF